MRTEVKSSSELGTYSITSECIEESSLTSAIFALKLLLKEVTSESTSTDTTIQYSSQEGDTREDFAAADSQKDTTTR